MKKTISTIAIALAMFTTFATGAFAKSEDLATEAQGKTLLIEKVKTDSIVGTSSFANEGAENLFDNDPATKFCTNTFPAEVTWSLDAAYVVDGVIICTANDNEQYMGRNPENWVLSGSTDGTNYTKIHEGTSADLEDVNFTYFLVNFENNTAYQYYKLEIPSAEAADVLQVSEFILVEKAGAAAEAPAAEETPAAEEVVEEAPVAEVTEAPAVTTAPATSDGVVAASVLSLALASVVGMIASKKRSK